MLYFVDGKPTKPYREIAKLAGCSLGMVSYYKDTKKAIMNINKNSGRKQGRGDGSIRNYGIEAANGEYIAFLDDDDVWLENKWISKWCNGFSKNDGYPRYIGIDGMHSLPLKISKNLKAALVV